MLIDAMDLSVPAARRVVELARSRFLHTPLKDTLHTPLKDTPEDPNAWLRAWLHEFAVAQRAVDQRKFGYLFQTHCAEGKWCNSNASKTCADAFVEAGLSWATPHTLRRTVATVIHKQETPTRNIAVVLGQRVASTTESYIKPQWETAGEGHKDALD